jgi:hypothetical protein
MAFLKSMGRSINPDACHGFDQQHPGTAGAGKMPNSTFQRHLGPGDNPAVEGIKLLDGIDHLEIFEEHGETLT